MPVTILLNDTQLRFDAAGWTEYHEIEAKVQAASGLQPLSAIPFEWAPWSDDLTFHFARILRGGQTIDVLPTDGSFTVLRRETGLDQAMLTGQLTALLQPEGLQVGDVLDVAVSIRHADPLLKGKIGTLFANWDLSPVGRMRLEARWPSSLAVRWRETAGLPPLRRVEANGVTTVSLELDDVLPPVLPAHAPARYRHGRQIEFTTFSSWEELAQIMAPLFVKAAELGPQSPVAAQAELIAKSSSDPKVRAAAALRLVQDDIRYLAHGEAAGGYTPQSADETWRLRYGDCKAKTVLLLALLHELEVPAEPVLASTTGGDGLDTHLPSATLFNHVLVRVRLDGRDYWLDGTRQGDRQLDDVPTAAYGWVLPLSKGDGRLVHVGPAPAARPQIMQVIRYDASGDVGAPEPTRLETIFRGDTAWLIHAQVTAILPERLDAALKAYWAGVHTAFTPAHMEAAWDPAMGEEKLTATGTSKLEWSSSGLELQHVEFGGAPNIGRDPAASDPGAPYLVEFPTFSETDESVVMQPAKTPTADSLKTIDVDRTIAGIAYRRSASVDGNIVRVVASQRSLEAEISASEARASVDPLTKLGQQGVYVAARLLAKTATDAAAPAQPTAVAGHLDRGNTLLDAGRYKEALDEFDAAIALAPKSQRAWADRAIAHAWLSDTAATADADRADALGQPEIIAARARGVLAANLGDLPGARTAYHRALTIKPDDAFSLRHLIDVEIAVANFDAARKDLDMLLQQHPELLPDAHLWRAFIDEAAHDKAAAERELAQVPVTTAEARLGRARAYLRLGDRDLARIDADVSIHLKPSAGAWLVRASADGGYASAEANRDAGEALRLAPDDLNARLWMVNAATSRHDYGAALPMVDRLVSQHPDVVGNLLVGWAEIEGELGRAADMEADFAHARTANANVVVLCSGEVHARFRPEAALLDCQRATRQHPNSVRSHLNEIVILHRLNRSAETADAIARVDISVHDPVELNDICYSLAGEDVGLDRALHDCDASLKLRPDNPATLDSRAFVLMRLGRDAEALSAYDTSLGADPREYNSMYGRGVLELRLGRAAEGLRDETQALAARPYIREDFRRMGVTN